MKNTVLLLTLATLLVGGCTDQQLANADKGVQDANKVTTAAERTVKQLQDSPVGALIPPQVYQIMQLLGLGMASALGVWKWLQASGLLRKNQDLAVTLKAVVDGVSASGKKADPVKAQIKQIMLDREVYSTANPIVDQVKSQAPGKIS